ncbi:MAG: riboflavin kinase [Eubacteriales bacterium]|jgi:riboflavin kinase/FMN adenylyltransferase
MTTYKNPYREMKSPCAVALGTFDGFHIGHAAVVGEAVAASKRLGCAAAVFCFRDIPYNFFNKNKMPLICDADEKKRLFREAGVDYLIMPEITRELLSLSAEEFLDLLSKTLHPMFVSCGFNYTFGAGKNGSPDFLYEYFTARGVEVKVVPPVTSDGEVISSTLVRRAIENGNTEEAKKLLGRPFSINTLAVGTSCEGELPCVRQVIREGCLIPKNGVYLTRAIIGHKSWYGITNIRTLCDSAIHRTADTRLLQFRRPVSELYGRKLRIEFLHFLRKEESFASAEELRARLSADEAEAKAIIERDYTKNRI